MALRAAARVAARPDRATGPATPAPARSASRGQRQSGAKNLDQRAVRPRRSAAGSRAARRGRSSPAPSSPDRGSRSGPRADSSRLAAAARRSGTASSTWPARADRPAAARARTRPPSAPGKIAARSPPSRVRDRPRPVKSPRNHGKKLSRGQPRRARPWTAAVGIGDNRVPVTSPTDADGFLPPGSALGQRYRLDRPIGAGSMGAVYAARDLAQDRPVALKIINLSHTSDATMVARFQREGRIIAGRHHPNVVEVFDVAQIERDWVMETICRPASAPTPSWASV